MGRGDKDEECDERPTQWFTPTSGLPNSSESVRATSATDCRGPPMPGPFDKY
jgi:hypothetical protein